MFNNYDTDPEQFNVLQDVALAFKGLLSLFILIEISLFYWESRQYKKFVKEKIQGFEKCTEEERRADHSKSATRGGIIFLIIFLVLLLAGLVFASSRTCLPTQALEMGVC